MKPQTLTLALFLFCIFILHYSTLPRSKPTQIETALPTTEYKSKPGITKIKKIEEGLKPNKTQIEDENSKNDSDINENDSTFDESTADLPEDDENVDNENSEKNKNDIYSKGDENSKYESDDDDDDDEAVDDSIPTPKFKDYNSFPGVIEKKGTLLDVVENNHMNLFNSNTWLISAFLVVAAACFVTACFAIFKKTNKYHTVKSNCADYSNPFDPMFHKGGGGI